MLPERLLKESLNRKTTFLLALTLVSCVVRNGEGTGVSEISHPTPGQRLFERGEAFEGNGGGSQVPHRYGPVLPRPSQAQVRKTLPIQFPFDGPAQSQISRSLQSGRPDQPSSDGER